MARHSSRTLRPETKAKLTKVFWFFFSKKNKYFFLKKEAKTFVTCSLFADASWSGRWRFSNAIALRIGLTALDSGWIGSPPCGRGVVRSPREATAEASRPSCD
ncbi:MAG: hypothetical protein WDN04_00125 [Rhodospirillales bacterium]